MVVVPSVGLKSAVAAASSELILKNKLQGLQGLANLGLNTAAASPPPPAQPPQDHVKKDERRYVYVKK
uniref:Uncharacterized protein n=1 Tax=Oryza sativa subsp. japonica TaxID=39947 RepID=Q8LIA4_ORYSJ|nr:hypothetical protein [Oryza sativa Japonica Group]